MYVGEDGSILHGYATPKDILDEMRRICRGVKEPVEDLCRAYNAQTEDGRDMAAQTDLLASAIGSIVEGKNESDIDSFFSGGTTGFLENDIEGIDDFELVCFLVVKRPC